MAETNMCNRFDFVSNGRVVYKGTQYTEYEELEQPKPKEPEKKEFDGSSLTGKVIGAVVASACVAAAFGALTLWGASLIFSGGTTAAAGPLVLQCATFLLAAAPIAIGAGKAISDQYSKDMENEEDSGWETYAKIGIVDPVVVGAQNLAFDLTIGLALKGLGNVASKLKAKMFKPKGKNIGFTKKNPASSNISNKKYSSVRYIGSTKVDGEVRDISRKVYQRHDIDWSRIDPESGLTNVQLAQKGRSPYWNDGTKIELHHLTQTEPSAMVEIPASLHDKYTKILHGLVENGGSFRNNATLEKQYNNFRVQYWKWRAAQNLGF